VKISDLSGNQRQFPVVSNPVLMPDIGRAL
jgi:hypothetical protein